jgi:hypothetical protein
MQLHAVDWRYERPPTEIFAKLLGARGDEALKALSSYMHEHPDTRTESFYSPIISEVAFSSHMPACQSQYRKELQASIGNVSEVRC